jgi:hypothetical protein
LWKHREKCILITRKNLWGIYAYKIIEDWRGYKHFATQNVRKVAPHAKAVASKPMVWFSLLQLIFDPSSKGKVEAGIVLISQIGKALRGE